MRILPYLICLATQQMDMADRPYREWRRCDNIPAATNNSGFAKAQVECKKCGSDVLAKEGGCSKCGNPLHWTQNPSVKIAAVVVVVILVVGFFD